MSGSGEPRRIHTRQKAYVALAGRVFGPAAVIKGRERSGGCAAAVLSCLIPTRPRIASRGDGEQVQKAGAPLHIPVVEKRGEQIEKEGGHWKRLLLYCIVPW